MVVEAQRWRQEHEQRNGYVQSGVLKQWLAIVISGSARRQADDIDDAARLSALMFAVEEHPAYCFTKTTLRDAQRRFKFLPTPAELLEFADAIVSAETLKAERLWAIVNAGVRTGGADDGDAVGRSMRLNREKQDLERRHLAAIVEAKHGPLPDSNTAPTMEAGESRASFIDRLREWRKNPVQRVVPVDETLSETAETRAVDAEAPGGAA